MNDEKKLDLSLKANLNLLSTTPSSSYTTPRQHVWDKYSDIKQKVDLMDRANAIKEPSPLERYLSESNEIDYAECGRKIAETMQDTNDDSGEISNRSHLDVVKYLKLVEKIWIKASESSDGLDHEAFIDFLLPMLSVDRETLSILFHKMDANSDGSLSWDEYLSYLHREIKHRWKFRVAKGTHHLQFGKQQAWSVGSTVRSILVIPSDAQTAARYIISCADETLQVWESQTMTHLCNVPLDSHAHRRKAIENRKISKLNNVMKTEKKLQQQKQQQQQQKQQQQQQRHDTHKRSNQSSYKKLNAVPHTCVTFYKKSAQLVVGCSDRTIAMYAAVQNSYFLVDAFVTNATPRCMTIITLSQRKQDCLIVGETDGNITVYRIKDKKIIKHFMAHNGEAVRKIEFMSDVGLITSGMDGTVAIWDIDKWNCTNRLIGHERGVYSFAYCHDNKCLLSAGYDKDILVWDRFQNTPTERINIRQCGVLEVLSNERKNQIITVCNDKKVRVHDVRTLMCLQTLVDSYPQGGGDRITAAAFDSEQQQLIIAGTHIRLAKVVIAPENLDRQDGAAHTSLVVAICYSNTFKLLISVTIDGSVSLWNVHTGENTFGFNTYTSITAACLGPQGKRLITASIQDSISIWNFNNGACLQKLSGPKAEVSQLLYLKKASHSIISISRDSHIVRYPDPSAPKSTEMIHQKLRSGEPVCAAAHNQNFVTGSNDGILSVWFSETTNEKKRIILRDNNDIPIPVCKMKFIELNGYTILLVCTEDSSMRFYEESTFDYLGSWDNIFNESIQGICVNTEGTRLMVADVRNSAIIWDTSNFSCSQIDNVLKIKQWHIFEKANFTDIVYIEYIEAFCVASDSGDMSLWTTSGQIVAIFGETKPWPLCSNNVEELVDENDSEDTDEIVKPSFEQINPMFVPTTTQKAGLRAESFSLSFVDKKDRPSKLRSRLMQQHKKKEVNTMKLDNSKPIPNSLDAKLSALDHHLVASWVTSNNKSRKVTVRRSLAPRVAATKFDRLQPSLAPPLHSTGILATPKGHKNSQNKVSF